MKRTGGRLTLIGALGRQTALDPLPAGSETNSASLSKAEKDIKALKIENHRLRRELEDVRSLYNQLLQENSHERFDERRVTLLKSQVIQLERQVLLMSEALSSRTETLMEVENALTWLADRFRSYITKEVKGPEVSVPRSDLTLMVETAESARIKLYKQLENRTTEKLSRQLMFFNEFIHPSRENDVTLLEVASGSLEHLNLKQVAKLETKLSTLYRELINLHTLLEQDTEVTQAPSPCMWSSSHVTLASRERLLTQILKSCAMMKDCTSDLLDVSLLFPSAPWPPLKKPALKEITAERVLKCLPVLAKVKSAENQRVIHALVKAYNYKVYMLSSQIKGLKDETKYHKKVYNLQLKYTESLFQAIREGYSQFEESTSEVIVKPLKDILEAYVELNHTASETALKTFLRKFKDRAAQFNDIVETLAVKEEESEGSKVLSNYGDEFFTSLEKLVHDQQVKRDREVNQREDIRQEQERLDQELREILDEQECRLQDSLLKSAITDNSMDENSVIHADPLHAGFIKSKTDLGYGDSDRIKSLDSGKKSQGHADDGKVKTEVRKQRDVVRSPDSDKKSGRKTQRESGSKKKRPEWNNDFTGEIANLSPEDTTDAPDTIDAPDNKESVYSVREDEMHRLQPDLAHTVDENRTEQNDSQSKVEIATKPPRIKKKLNYTPNTFVPNRTLQLRRTGSLTKLSDNKSDYQTEKSVPHFVSGSSPDEQPTAADFVREDSGKNVRARSLSKDRAGSKIPSKRPAFK